MNKLKELLGDELFSQVEPKLKDANLLIAEKGEFVPRSRLNEEIEKAKTLSEQLNELQNSVKKFSKLETDNEELKTQLNQFKELANTQKREYEAKLNKIQIESAVEKTLMKENAINPTVVKKLIDMDALKVDGDTVIGLTDQLTKIKETDPYLFKSADKKTPNPPNGTPSAKTEVNPFKKGEGFSLIKQIEIAKTNPALAEKLRQEALASE